MIKVLIVDDIRGWIDFHSAVIKELFGENAEIYKAESAAEANNKLIENTNSPYDIILTDLQMEDDYAPKLAGEWLVEQIKTFSQYYRTKIVIISASYNARMIADNLGVFCIPKTTARTCISAYKEILLN
ncbi:response regulator [bacterium]|nr:response regulator [bacterium]